MIYAILAYHAAGIVESWSPEEDAALMEDLHKVHRRLTDEGKLGPAARLGPTGRAFTLRGAGEGIVTDGPFAETKEQLLGFYVARLCRQRRGDCGRARSAQGQPDRRLRDPGGYPLSAGGGDRRLTALS